MNTSEMPHFPVKTPWTIKYQGRFFDWLRYVEGRWAQYKTRLDPAPSFIDRWGVPYWLKTELDDEGKEGLYTLQLYSHHRRKNNFIARVYLGWKDPEKMTLSDIVIFNGRDRGRGIGDFLLKKVITLAQNKGMSKIVGELVPEHEVLRAGVVKFYESHGFSVSIRYNKQNKPIHWLELDLRGGYE